MYYSVKKKIDNIIDIILTLKKTYRAYFHVKQRNEKKNKKKKQKSFFFLYTFPVMTESYYDSSKTYLTYLYAKDNHPQKFSC